MYPSQPIRSTDIVFLGDSLTESFDLVKHFGRNDLRNRGISGNMTAHVLYRLEEIVLTRPAKLFLMIGINDIYQGIDLETIFENIRQITGQLTTKNDHTKIYIQSILPVNEDRLLAHEQLNTKIYTLNGRLQRFCRDNGFTFVDLYPEFLNHSGQLDNAYTFDGVHLNEQGYVLWAELLQEYL
jgi:lysophospholipase L1-like esterase